MANLQEITKLIAVVSLAYPRYELPEGTVHVYAGLLSDIPADALEAAARQLMVESKFFPSIAEWREKALDLMTGIYQIPSSAEAWEEVMQQINKVGHNTSPEFSHPVIRKAVDCFGWKTLCMSESIEFDRSQFFKVYEILVKRAKDIMSLLPESRKVTEKYVLGIGNLAKKLGGG